MPIWGEVELFCQAVFEEGRNEAGEILDQAKSEADRILADARRRSEKEFQQQMLAAKTQTHAEARQLVDAAELAARKRIIAFREEVIREVLSALAQRLKAFRQTPAYPDFLLSVIREGIDALPGKAFAVELAEEDLNVVAAKIAELAGQRALQIEVTGSPSLDGGARIYSHDRRLLYDNSLAARLKRREDEIHGEIWRKILGAQNGASEWSHHPRD